uniref:CCHC-type domain-containing protein n=1 Tax=Ficedula albicollis TaxID=59894 RepID=A0A803WEJ9_FICAL
MNGASTWTQTEQMAPLYRPVPMEAQPSAAQPSLTDWANIRMNLVRDRECPAIGTGDIVMPVPYDAQGQNPRWERLNREVLKDIIKEIRDNGLGSSYFQRLLKGAFDIYDLTAHDLRSLVSLILTDTQALIWDSRWRRALQELRTRYQGGRNAALTLAELAGDPPNNDPAQRARLPREVLTDIKEAARQAILQIAPAGVQDTVYTDIRQGAAEPFSSFTDRLTRAVDRQVTHEAAKPHLLRTLAFENANQECKRIIRAIPGQLSLAEMVQACSEVGTPQQIASIVKEQMERVLRAQNEKFECPKAYFPQALQVTPESQMLIPQPGPRTTQQRVQVPAVPLDPRMNGASTWTQTQQMVPLYRPVPMEAQPSAAQPSLTDWANIRMNLVRDRECPAIGTGDIVMPVPYDAQGQNPRWERLNREVLKDIIKEIRDNGLGSSYFQRLLKGAFDIYDLTAHDLRSLVSLILTDTQALIWDSRWRRALQELRTRYQGGRNAALTLAELAGDPPNNDPAQRARLPREVLTDIKEAARQAILQIAPAGVQDTVYTDIRQGAAEPFSSFTDRLTRAVDRQVTHEAAKPHLLRTLAFENANQECKRIIRAIPGQLSLAEMVQACSEVGTPQQIASIVKEQMERVLRAQNEKFEKLLANFKKKNNSRERRCYNCGGFGHFKKNCPQLANLSVFELSLQTKLQ